MATELLEPFEARVGSTLRGKWTLERLIGVGGMAAVYAARHQVTGNASAIKILHPEVARLEDLRARFEREARVMGRLDHPGCVRVLDIDETAEGAPFLVMDLLEGESLKERVKRHGHLPLPELLKVADAALDVLAEAHEQGIVHRDIKPDNLFITRAGQLKVLDFGIARMREGRQMTMLGERLGTLPYMPPEQVMGEEVDHRVDLFAMGAVLFRIVAGRRVHDVKTESEMVIAMSSRPAPPLGSVVPTAPEGLCHVVDRALAFDRNQRYATARAMQADIQALRRGEQPTAAAPLSATKPGAPVSAPPTRLGAVNAAAFAATVEGPGSAPTRMGTSTPTAAATPYETPGAGAVVVVHDGAPMSATAMPDSEMLGSLAPGSEMPKTGLITSNHPSALSDHTRVSSSNEHDATMVSSGTPAPATSQPVPSATPLASGEHRPASSNVAAPNRGPLIALAAAAAAGFLLMLGIVIWWAASGGDPEETTADKSKLTDEVAVEGAGGADLGSPADDDEGVVAQPKPTPTPIKLPTYSKSKGKKKKKKKKKKK